MEGLKGAEVYSGRSCDGRHSHRFYFVMQKGSRRGCKAVLKVLHSMTLDSKLSLQCRNLLNNLTKERAVELI